MKALCDHPDERRKWMDDFEGLAGTAVEEIVRWASPVIHMRRTCTRDTVLGGQEMKEGDKVVLWYNSGNRDEAVFDDPHRFDLQRKPNEHVGFGGPGPHFCLGANLARREIKVMFHRIPASAARSRDHGRSRPPAIELHPRHQAHALRLHAGQAGELRRARNPALRSARGTK